MGTSGNASVHAMPWWGEQRTVSARGRVRSAWERKQQGKVPGGRPREGRSVTHSFVHWFVLSFTYPVVPLVIIS